MNTEKKKTKVDLVTGFLGAGKTTFIKKYARYLLDKGCKIDESGAEYWNSGE